MSIGRSDRGVNHAVCDLLRFQLLGRPRAANIRRARRLIGFVTCL